MFEKQAQAKILIPMTVPLGFGILLTTLILVPINYLLVERIKGNKIKDSEASVKTTTA